MADGVINVSCPGCNAVFELPASLGGETGECTECGSIFEIPKIEAVKEGKLQTTDTGSVKVGKASPEGATNTVKLSRASIGMVPDIKDSFQFGVVNKAPTATHAGGSPMTATSTRKSFKAPPPPSPTSTSTATKTKTQPPRQQPPKQQKSWLQKLMFWK